MEGAFDFNTRAMLCLNRRLPYGTTGPDVDFFEAAFEGDIPRLRGKSAADRQTPVAPRCADAAAAAPGHPHCISR